MCNSAELYGSKRLSYIFFPDKNLATKEYDGAINRFPYVTFEAVVFSARPREKRGSFTTISSFTPIILVGRNVMLKSNGVFNWVLSITSCALSKAGWPWQIPPRKSHMKAQIAPVCISSWFIVAATQHFLYQASGERNTIMCSSAGGWFVRHCSEVTVAKVKCVLFIACLLQSGGCHFKMLSINARRKPLEMHYWRKLVQHMGFGWNVSSTPCPKLIYTILINVPSMN